MSIPERPTSRDPTDPSDQPTTPRAAIPPSGDVEGPPSGWSYELPEEGLPEEAGGSEFEPV